MPRFMNRQVATLGIANGAESAIQLLTPIVLVRVLDEAAFGDYRLLWLAAATLLAIVPFGMTASLAYFLPRHDLRAQAAFVRQTLLYMAAAGALAGLALAPWNPLLPHSLRTMAGAELAAPLFWALWVFGSMLDVLLLSERRIELQARLIFGLALLRGGAVIAAAVLGGIHAVIGVLALVAAAKAFLLLAMPSARYGRLLWSGRMSRWLEQAGYAIPVGANAAAYMLRLQADQWLVVVLFGAAQFGVYSIGAVALALGTIIRTTITSVIFPDMSKAQAEGDLAKLLSINNRANAACALFLLPVLAFLFAAAAPLVKLIYTDLYAGAIPVLRLNVVAFLVAVAEISTVMLALSQGPFLLLSSVISLPVGLLASYAGSQVWGMPGAAAGIVAGNFLAIAILYARATRLVALPVGALQDWGAIARVGAASTIAGTAAYGTLLLVPPAFGHVGAIVISAAVFCCAYLPGLIALGQGDLLAEVLGLPPGLRRRLV